MEPERYITEYLSKDKEVEKLERELMSNLRKGKALPLEKVAKYNSLVSKGKGYIDEVTL